MAEPTLRDMFRWSGGSHSPPTTLPGDTSQSAVPTSTFDRGFQTTTTSQPNDDSESSSDESSWYRSGSKYPTPHQQAGNLQQYSDSPQPPKSSQASATQRQNSSENQPTEASQASGAGQRLNGGSQPPSVSRPSDDRPRYGREPQTPAVSRPYEEEVRYTIGPELRTSTQTSDQTRPSGDKPPYASIQQTPPQQATGGIRQPHRYSSGGQAFASQPPTSNTSRPYDDRHHYNVRTSDDRQRFSNAPTITQPVSARQSEDKKRYSSGLFTTVPGSATDSVRTGVATNVSVPGSGTTANQANDPNILKRPTNSRTAAIDNTAISSDNAKASGKPEQDLDSRIDFPTFCALLGYPQAKGRLPVSLINQLVEDEDENHRRPSVKLPTRTMTGESAVTVPFKLRSRRPSFLPWFPRRKRKDYEFDTGVYDSVVREENRTNRLYRLYDTLTYACLFAQLIISAVLIILGAINGDYHIPVAVLGAVTGVITGILSLIRGQGLPQRMMRYADGLRRVKEDIEFKGRELMAGVRTVTYRECVKLRTDFENVKDDAVKNHPDTWTNWSSSSDPEKPSNGKEADLEKGRR